MVSSRKRYTDIIFMRGGGALPPVGIRAPFSLLTPKHVNSCVVPDFREPEGLLFKIRRADRLHGHEGSHHQQVSWIWLLDLCGSQERGRCPEGGPPP